MSTARAQAGKALNITSGTTTLVKGGPGTLLCIIVNKAVVSTTITIYDSLTATGTKIGTITHPGTLLASGENWFYDCQFTTGLCIVTSGADDITVVYS